MTQIPTEFSVEHLHIDPSTYSTTLPVRLDVGDVIVLDDGPKDSAFDTSDEYSVRRVTNVVSTESRSFRVRYVVVPVDQVEKWEEEQLKKQRNKR